MPSFTIRLLTGFAVALLFAQTANAGPYGTLGFSIEDIQPEDDFESFSGTGVNARLGYNFGRYFGVEAEGQIGLSGEGDNPRFQDGLLDQNETYNYKRAWSLYFRPQFPVSDELSLSFRAGFGAKYFDRTVDNPFLSDDNEARIIAEKSSIGHLALGAGAEYRFGELKLDSVRLDFTRRLHPGSLSDGDEEAFADSQVTVSYARKF